MKIMIARMTLVKDTKRNLEQSFDDEAAAPSIDSSWSRLVADEEYGSSVGTS